MEKILLICILLLSINTFTGAKEFVLGHLETPSDFPENAAKQRLKIAENLNFNTLYVESIPLYENPTSIQILSHHTLRNFPLYEVSSPSVLYRDSYLFQTSTPSTPFLAKIDLMSQSKPFPKAPFADPFSVAIEKQFAFTFKRQIESLMPLENCRGIILNSEMTPMRAGDVNLLFDLEYRMKWPMNAETFKSLFAPCVTLAQLRKHNAYANESLDITLMARSNRKDFNNVSIKWELRNRKDLILKEGATRPFNLKMDSVLIRKMRLNLNDLPTLTPLTFRTYLRCESNHALTEVATQPLTIYPVLDALPALDSRWGDSVIVTDSLPLALDAIRAQKRVLLFAKTWGNHSSKDMTSLNAFEESLLFQNNHPLLSPLVCLDYLDFYWENVGKTLVNFDITSLNSKTAPIALSAPLHNSFAYSPLFEFSVDTAKVLVCGFDLCLKREAVLEKVYFKKALYDYIISDQFKPTDTALIQWVEKTFAPPEKKQPKDDIKPISFETKKEK